jgi:hypothetical protein
MKIIKAILISTLALAMPAVAQNSYSTNQEQYPSQTSHRFQPVAGSEGNLAMDLNTGRMCKTWHWECKPLHGGPYAYHQDPFSGQWVPDTAYGISCDAVTSIPTCDDIVLGVAVR